MYIEFSILHVEGMVKVSQMPGVSRITIQRGKMEKWVRMRILFSRPLFEFYNRLHEHISTMLDLEKSCILVGSLNSFELHKLQ